MSDEFWPRPARGWRWLGWVPPILGILIGAWFWMSLTWLVGALPGKATNHGTAEIASCHRDPIRLWMVYTCEAEVTLVEPARVEHMLTSIEPLSGTVAVELAGVSWRSPDVVVPADRPHWSLGDAGLWVFLVSLPGIGAFAGLGIFIFYRLGWRVPQAPPEPKDFRGVRRLPAGPRRGRRKRRVR